MRLDRLEKALPICFALNKQNYARYGTIYVYSLANIETTHPGYKMLLLNKGLSVQAQSRYSLRTSIDQHGEQTINRDVKTSGGIKSFASNKESIHKWTLNHPYQAENCILTNKEKIHDLIKRQEKALFKNSGKKVTVKKNGKEKIIEAKGEITGTLLALSAKHGKLIDFETALQYFLCPVPLSHAHPDSTRCKMTKNALMKVAKSYKTSTEEYKLPPKQNAAFLVDLMALIPTVSPVPVTYAELGKTVNQLPKGYQRVNIIADTYRENSLKNNERDSRGVFNKVIICSALSRIPRNFTEFSKNGDNKTTLKRRVH